VTYVITASDQRTARFRYGVVSLIEVETSFGGTSGKPVGRRAAGFGLRSWITNWSGSKRFVSSV
jgi:hypothetical protein